MDLRLKTGLGVGLIVVGVLSLAGCPNPNTYATPRTAGSGHINHSIAIESWGFSFKDSAGNTVSATLPTAPTYSLHVGIGDQFEIGARIANMSSLGGDLKWNPIRSRVFDAAIDPSFQYFQLSTTTGSGGDTSFSVTYFHVPVLLGLNLSKSVTLVATPGVSYGLASASTNTTSSDRAQASGTTGALARFGVGASFRVTNGFALHPEITLLHSFRSETANLYMIGLGFNFGGMPSYADLEESGQSPTGYPPTPPPPPYAPPPPYTPPPPYPAPPPAVK
jgi:hypothetical protein